MAGRDAVETAACAAEAVPFLRALLVAKNNLRLYPAANPMVGASLAEAATLLASFAGSEPLTLAVQRDALQVGNLPAADTDGRFRRIAAELYQRAVGSITFAPGTDPGALEALLTTLNRPVEDLLLTGGPAAQPALAGNAHIAIEHHGGVTIVAGGDETAGFEQLLKLADDTVRAEHLDQPAGASQFFLRVTEGDPDRAARLQQLLAAPERLTLVFENFMLHVAEEEGADTGVLVSQLLRVLEAAGDIIQDMADEGERHKMYRGLAEAVSGLRAEVKDPLILQALLPRVPLQGLEARILRLLPMHELADAYSRAAVLDEGVSGALADCLTGLDLAPNETEMLAALVQSKLETAGALTPERERACSEVALRAMPDATDSPIAGAGAVHVVLPEACTVDPEAVQWKGREYRKLRQEARRESLKTEDMNELALLTGLLGIERRLTDFFTLIGQARQLLGVFLEKEQYAQATQVARMLVRQREDWLGELSQRQMARLDRILQSLVDEQSIGHLLRVLQDAGTKSLEARQIHEYFAVLGESLVRHLLDRLATEESRHQRLFLCNIIAELAGDHVDVVAERLDKAEWYVARNVLTIVDKMRTPRAATIAARALRHPEERVVREAMKTLAHLRTPEAITALGSALQLPKNETRTLAASWLGIVGDPRAVDALAMQLEPDPYALDREYLLAIVEALGRIGTQAARAALDPLAVRGGWFTRRRRAPIREAALQALAQPEREYEYA